MHSLSFARKKKAMDEIQWKKSELKWDTERGQGKNMFIFKCSMASFCYKNLAQTDFLKC